MRRFEDRDYLKRQRVLEHRKTDDQIRKIAMYVEEVRGKNKKVTSKDAIANKLLKYGTVMTELLAQLIKKVLEESGNYRRINLLNIMLKMIT